MRCNNLASQTILLIGFIFSTTLNAATVPPVSYSFIFGSETDLAAPCTTQGSSSDRNCSRGISINNGAVDSTAKFSVSAQASADASASSGSLIGKATIEVNYSLPFYVTRQVSVVALGDQYIAVAPELSLDLSYLYGAVAATKDEVGSGNERADVGELTITLTDAAPWNVAARGQSGISGINRNVANANTTRSITVATGTSTGEVGSLADIPLTFNSWNDEVAQFVDYSTNSSFEQTYAGLINVQVLLSARSESTGLFGNGGEAIACFGRGSGLSDFLLDGGGCPVGFSLDLDPVEDGGLSITGSLTQTAISINLIGPVASVVPVPAAAWLFGSGLLGLVGVARRKKA